MPGEEVLPAIEEAPHIELNQDGATIGFSNWFDPPNRNWAYRHIVDVLPFTQVISRGEGPVHPLAERPMDLGGVRLRYRDQELGLEEYLHESHCNGFVVLRGDEILYESYPRMEPDERHLLQSVSKTTVCAMIGPLVAEGLIDLERTVDEFFPSVGSGFSGVKLQDALDMNVALNFSEDFADPEAEIFEYEMLTGWRPDKAGTGLQARGMLPYISRLEHDSGHELNGWTHYLCPNTDILGCLIEKVTDRRYTDLFAEKIYRHIGAEADGYLSVDTQGMALCSGGLILRPRDLARYGRIFAKMGVANDGVRVIPESWLEECRDTSKGTRYYLGEGYRYHNQMTSNGEAFCHLGVGGQMLYANPETKVVVVQVSTTTAPSNGDLDFGNALYAAAAAVDRYVTERREERL